MVIVEGKHGLGKESVFDFRYIPDYHVTTDRGGAESAAIKESGIERRNLKALIIALTCAGLASYCAVWAVSNVIRIVWLQFEEQ